MYYPQLHLSTSLQYFHTSSNKESAQLRGSVLLVCPYYKAILELRLDEALNREPDLELIRLFFRSSSWDMPQASRLVLSASFRPSSKRVPISCMKQRAQLASETWLCQKSITFDYSMQLAKKKCL